MLCCVPCTTNRDGVHTPDSMVHTVLLGLRIVRWFVHLGPGPGCIEYIAENSTDHLDCSVVTTVECSYLELRGRGSIPAAFMLHVSGWYSASLHPSFILLLIYIILFALNNWLQIDGSLYRSLCRFMIKIKEGNTNTKDLELIKLKRMELFVLCVLFLCVLCVVWYVCYVCYVFLRQFSRWERIQYYQQLFLDLSIFWHAVWYNRID